MNKSKNKKSQSRKIDVSKHGSVGVTDDPKQETVRRIWLDWFKLLTKDQKEVMKTVTDVVNDIQNNNAITVKHKMAEMVSHLCAKHNLNKKELAKETGLSPITIRRLLDKAHTPGKRVITNIVEYDMKNSEASQKENKSRGAIEMEASKETNEKILAMKGSSDVELRNNTTNLITNILANTEYSVDNLAYLFDMEPLELKDIYMKNVTPTDYILEQLVEYAKYKNIQFDLFKVNTNVDVDEINLYQVASDILKERQLGFSKIKEIIVKLKEVTGLGIVKLSSAIPLGKSSLWYALKEERLLSIKSLIKILECASKAGIIVDPVTLTISVIDVSKEEESAEDAVGEETKGNVRTCEVLTSGPLKLDHISIGAPSANYDGNVYGGGMISSHSTANIIDRLNSAIVKRLRSISEKHIESINIKHLKGTECITIELNDGCVLTMSTPPKK